jgi:hypothetical protein
LVHKSNDLGTEEIKIQGIQRKAINWNYELITDSIDLYSLCSPSVKRTRLDLAKRISPRESSTMG